MSGGLVVLNTTPMSSVNILCMPNIYLPFNVGKLETEGKPSTTGKLHNWKVYPAWGSFGYLPSPSATSTIPLHTRFPNMENANVSGTRSNLVGAPHQQTISLDLSIPSTTTCRYGFCFHWMCTTDVSIGFCVPSLSVAIE